MAAAMAAGRAAAASSSSSAPGSVLGRSRRRFRGCLLGALLGDCLGGRYEALPSVDGPELLRFVRGLGRPQRKPRSPEGRDAARAEEGEKKNEEEPEILSYSDDTAMTHCVVKSLMAKRDFDEVDMAKRFAEEYKRDPGRDYGAGVITVFKKLLSPKCSDVFEPARQQFNGKGSYGNGGAMRVAGIPLAYSNVQDVKKFAKLSAQLTHSNSLGYNGAILQALAVHYALQGDLNRDQFLEQLIGHMEDVEADEKSVADAQMLGYEELPFSKRLKKIKEFLERSRVPSSDVVLELVASCYSEWLATDKPPTYPLASRKHSNHKKRQEEKNTPKAMANLNSSNNPECSLEGQILKLRLQYFGHLMRREDSLEKPLILGKSEGKRRRGRQRMRWMDRVTEATQLREAVEDRRAWRALVRAVTTKQQHMGW